MSIKPHLCALTLAVLLPTLTFANPTGHAGVLLENYHRSYQAARTAWPGFDPNQIPKIIIGRDANGTTSYLIVIDHPNPQAFGDTVQIGRADGQPGMAYLVADPKPNGSIVAVENFDFNLPLHAAPTFVIASRCDDPAFPMDCAKAPDFTAYLVHEVFHRWQDDTFALNDIADAVDQTVYDFSAANIAAILLENAVLAAALQSNDFVEKKELARQFIAIRDDRRTRFDHLDLDDQQERIEGTALHVELQISRALGQDRRLIDGLIGPFAPGTIKDEIGFGRFYATGAAQVALAISLGVEDVTGQISAGKAPAQLLSDYLKVPLDAREALIVAAKAAYDPEGDLAKLAAIYAKSALTEPDIF